MAGSGEVPGPAGLGPDLCPAVAASPALPGGRSWAGDWAEARMGSWLLSYPKVGLSTRRQAEPRDQRLFLCYGLVPQGERTPAAGWRTGPAVPRSQEGLWPPKAEPALSPPAHPRGAAAPLPTPCPAGASGVGIPRPDSWCPGGDRDGSILLPPEACEPHCGLSHMPAWLPLLALSRAPGSTSASRGGFAFCPLI